MQRRTVQDPQRASSTGGRLAVRGTVAKVAVGLVTAGATLASALAAGLGPAGSQSTCDPGTGPVAIIEVDGLLDPVLVDFVEDQIVEAEKICAVALVFQLDSGGGDWSGRALGAPSATPPGG